MNEEAIIFSHQNKNIRGIYTHSENDMLSDSLILFLGNPQWSSWGPRRIFSESARIFSQQGFCSFRFDTMTAYDHTSVGINSENEVKEWGIVITSLIKNIRENINSKIKKIILLGYCAGAFISILMSRNIKINALVLWSLKMDQYGNYKSFLTINNNYKWQYGTHDQNYILPVLIVNGELYSTFFEDELAINDIFPSGFFNTEYVSIKNGDQYFSSVHLKNELVTVSKTWLSNVLN